MYLCDVANHSNTKVLKNMVRLHPLGELGFLGKVAVCADDGHLELRPELADGLRTIVPLVVTDRGQIVAESVHNLSCDITLIVRVVQSSLRKKEKRTYIGEGKKDSRRRLLVQCHSTCFYSWFPLSSQHVCRDSNGVAGCLLLGTMSYEI